MVGPWEKILRAFQSEEAAGSTSEIREEPASTEPGKPTSTPQNEPSRKPTRKAPMGKPKAP